MVKEISLQKQLKRVINHILYLKKKEKNGIEISLNTWMT